MTSQSQTGSNRAEASSVRGRIIEAAMEIIAVNGWRQTRLEDLIVTAGVSEREFYGEFDGLLSVIAGASRRLDAAMLEVAEDFEPDESVRDRLFALLMARFDTAQPWRDAVRNLARASATDPLLATAGVRSLTTAATRALEAAGVDPHGVFGPGRVNALLMGVLLPVGRVWLKDDSEEMGKTMAELDKRLGQAERLAGWLGPLAGAGGGRKSGGDAAEMDTSRAPAPERAEPAPPRKTGATGKSSGAAKSSQGKSTGRSGVSSKTSKSTGKGGKSGGNGGSTSSGGGSPSGSSG